MKPSGAAPLMKERTTRLQIAGRSRRDHRGLNMRRKSGKPEVRHEGGGSGVDAFARAHGVGIMEIALVVADLYICQQRRPVLPEYLTHPCVTCANANVGAGC